MTNTTLPKAYEPKKIEDYWIKFWKEHGTFTPNIQAENEPFCIVIPPPNITGALHMGHAVNITIQDILCRYARQKGKNVLWIPGTDHAGIATQNAVERHLAKEGLSRHDLGREAFIQRVWSWREEYGSRILQQIQKLGASVDWSHERFTMDEGLSKAVCKAFVDLYKQGYIYKDKYIINWCIRCHTALADDEVVHQPHDGELYYIKYPIENSSESLTVATTRPETIVADTAICINPKDTRYTNYIGKNVIVPIMHRSVPIIADTYVDPSFGTGVLKVTPCHDSNDWLLGHKHNLSFIQSIDDKGCMNENAGPYTGLTREKSRIKILEDLEKQGFLIKKEPLQNSLGHCYRCDTVIEPYVSEQWFVATTKLAPKARAAIPKLTQIFPENWIKTYYNWLDSIRDWCISRQIWWGHRIPVWTCSSCKAIIVEETQPQACSCGSTNLIQEEDVLDTWFSSAIWPFSTLGWPQKTPELEKFYPTSVLVTGFDILFFWVARMMMFGIHFMDNIPFYHIYIHALVRDAEGKKMSKSSGNVIDPLKTIKTYGTDALRFTLTSFATMGRDIRLSEDRIEGYRHFINKLWNAARFALMNLPDEINTTCTLEAITELHHCWILHRLEEIKIDVDTAIKTYCFNDAAQILYSFLWNEFCDWYLELIKLDMKEKTEKKEQSQYILWTVLHELLILLHPIIPFITSELWKALPSHQNTDISCELFPQKRLLCLKPKEAQQMIFLQEIISAIRTIRSELTIAPAYKLSVLIIHNNKQQLQIIQEYSHVISTLAQLEYLILETPQEIPRLSARQIVQGCEVIVYLSGAIDIAIELKRLEKEQNKITKELVLLTQKLANPNFINRAPQELVQKERNRILELKNTQKKLIERKKLFQ